MNTLQFACYSAFDQATPFYGASRDFDTTTRKSTKHHKSPCILNVRVFAMSNSPAPLKMNLNEYMVTLEKPLGIRFSQFLEGKIIVHALRKGSNAERSRIIMVGDALKKVSGSSDGSLLEIKDMDDAQKLITEEKAKMSLILERPLSPFPLQQLLLSGDLDLMFNRGRVPVVTWNRSVLISNLRTSSQNCGNPGFATFSSKNLTFNGWKLLDEECGSTQLQSQKNVLAPLTSQLICTFSEEESADGEWGHGSFPLEEYLKALERANGEIYYDHSLGMRCSKITEQIYVGSCVQEVADVEKLSAGIPYLGYQSSKCNQNNWSMKHNEESIKKSQKGITAILNFQSGVEAENWGINCRTINEACQTFDVLMINYPIRDADSYDLMKKLPFCVGLLLRLLRKNHRVFVTCTSGFDRSPVCVIAYLHWMTDISLPGAYNFVTGLHLCKPNRAAIASATWDLIAMAEHSTLESPATHAVTFVWNGHEGEDVLLVGDFTGNWKDPIKASHKGGSRFEVEMRLPQGKYYYKYIINGQWRHSNLSPIERDGNGNTNNILVLGDIASVRPAFQPLKKDVNVVKVIERPLTEKERFMLAKAARCIAFSVCPIRLAPK